MIMIPLIIVIIILTEISKNSNILPGNELIPIIWGLHPKCEKSTLLVNEII